MSGILPFSEVARASSALPGSSDVSEAPDMPAWVGAASSVPGVRSAQPASQPWWNRLRRARPSARLVQSISGRSGGDLHEIPNIGPPTLRLLAASASLSSRSLNRLIFSVLHYNKYGSNLMLRRSIWLCFHASTVETIGVFSYFRKPMYSLTNEEDKCLLSQERELLCSDVFGF